MLYGRCHGDSSFLAIKESSHIIISLKTPMEDDKDVLLKMQRYLNHVPSDNLKRLNNVIESEEELCLIAAKLTKWDENYYLLGLEFHEVDDIQSQHKSPVVQRRKALQKWRDRVGAKSTYRNLLKVCVKGEWHDSAMVVVKLLQKSMGTNVDDVSIAKDENISCEVLAVPEIPACKSAINGAKAEMSSPLPVLLLHRSDSLSSELEYCSHTGCAFAFSMKNLQVLHIGPDKELHLIEEMSSQRIQAGDLLCLRPSHIRAIKESNRNVVDCCREVMAEWMSGMKDPPSWEGLYKLSSPAQHIINTILK